MMPSVNTESRAKWTAKPLQVLLLLLVMINAIAGTDMAPDDIVAQAIEKFHEIYGDESETQSAPTWSVHGASEHSAPWVRSETVDSSDTMENSGLEEENRYQEKSETEETVYETEETSSEIESISENEEVSDIDETEAPGDDDGNDDDTSETQHDSENEEVASTVDEGIPSDAEEIGETEETSDMELTGDATDEVDETGGTDDVTQEHKDTVETDDPEETSDIGGSNGNTQEENENEDINDADELTPTEEPKEIAETKLEIPDVFITASPTISTVPTLSPSLSVPTLSPSLSPRPTVSAAPSISSSPSPAPSTHPSVSISPSAQPSASAAPSSSPSAQPSVSAFPTMTPSATPTEVPSSSPSMFPTAMPSSSPSGEPSDEPSSMPSTAPTLECHDVADYRSPLNNLTCAHHANTDCTRWRFFEMMNITQVGELVENCPVSCGIECGSFTELDTALSFIIARLPGLLDYSTTPVLEDATLEYIEEFVVSKVPQGRFVLTDVELLSQDILQDLRRGSGLRRKLQLENVNLDVALKLYGFSINITDDNLMTLLLQGVDSPGYTSAIRAADDFFSDALVFSAVPEARPRVAEPTNNESKAVSITTVTVSTITAVAVVVFSVGFFIFQKRRRSTAPEIKCALSPVSETPHSQKPVSVYSYDLSPASSTGFGRLLAVFSSRSHDSTSPSSSQDQEEGSLVPRQLEVVEEEQHPYTGIIPPMIVIDNIDETPLDSEGETPIAANKVVVPTKHFAASQSFIEALRSAQKADSGNPSAFADILFDMNSFQAPSDAEYDVMSPAHRALKEIFSDDVVADDCSVSSTPMKVTDMNVDVPLRRTLSSGQLDEDADVKDMIDDFKRTQWNDDSATKLDASKTEETSSNGNSVSDHDDSLPEREIGASVSYTDRTPPSGVTGVSHRRSISWDRRSTLGLNTPKTPTSKAFAEARTVRRLNRCTSDIIPSIPPSSLELPISSDTPRRSTEMVAPIHQRKMPPRPGSCKTTDGSGSSHRGARSKSRSRGSFSSTDNSIEDGETLYVYETSHRGYLGLLIEPSRGGTKVHAVKEYSPLFGLVKAGDKIVDVDGVSTIQMETANVAKVLGRKKGGSRKVRITVARPSGKSSKIQALPLPKHSPSLTSRKGSDARTPRRSKRQHEQLSIEAGQVQLHTPPDSGGTDTSEQFHFIGSTASLDDNDDLCGHA